MPRQTTAAEDSEAARLRMKIMERDNWRCQFCGRRSNLQVHHIIYRSHRGPDAEDNLITLCAACHELIHMGKRPLVKHSRFRGLAAIANEALPAEIACRPFGKRAEGSGAKDSLKTR